MSGDARQKKVAAQTQHDLMVRVLQAAGGKTIEAVAPAGYTGQMADVLFDQADVIVEVKSLTTDRGSDARALAKVKRMFAENRHLGAPDPETTVTVGLHDLPHIIAVKALRIIGQRIQTEVGDANLQLKATKAGLGRPDALGVITIVTPPFTIDRKSVLWLINDAMREGRCSSVDAVFLVETPLYAPVDMQGRTTSFLSPHSRAGRSMPEPLAIAIGEAWGRVTGQAGQFSDSEEFHLHGATS